MKSLRLALLMMAVLFSFAVNLTWGAEYYFGPPGDDLIGIDAKESINDGNIELSIVPYITQQDLTLAKKFVRECIRSFPKDCPCTVELRKIYKQMKELKTVPDVLTVLALADAERDSAKISQ